MTDFWFETYYTRGYIVPCMMYDYIIIIIITYEGTRYQVP